MNIAILSRNSKLYSTQRLVEVATLRGHNAIVLNHTKCYVEIEKNKNTIHYQGIELAKIDAIIPRIGASVTAYGCAIVRQFETMSVFSVNTSQAIVRSRDKLRSMQLLSSKGIDIPKTAFARENKDVSDLIEMVGTLPIIIKVLEGTQGLGVILADTHKAAKSVIEAFYDIGTNILIQEFVREANGTDIRAFVVNGKVVGAIRRIAKDGEFRSNLHRGGRSEMITLNKKEKETAIKATAALGLSVAGVDMLPSLRGPLVLEVNSSPGLKGIESATQKNIAVQIIKYIEDNAKGKPQKDKIGV